MVWIYYNTQVLTVLKCVIVYFCPYPLFIKLTESVQLSFINIVL